MSQDATQNLVDHLVVAIEEQDVLFVLWWISELEKGNQLVAMIDRPHSWKGVTPLEAAASCPSSSHSKLILEVVILAGATITDTAVDLARKVENEEALLIMENWNFGRRELAIDARKLLDMTPEIAADWLDENLPADPTLSYSGYADLPPPPPPSPTRSTSITAESTYSLTTAESSAVSRSPPSEPADSNYPFPTSTTDFFPPRIPRGPKRSRSPVCRIILFDCPISLKNETIEQLAKDAKGILPNRLLLEDSCQVSFIVLKGEDAGWKVVERLDGSKVQGVHVRAELEVARGGEEGREEMFERHKRFGQLVRDDRGRKRKNYEDLLPPSPPPAFKERRVGSRQQLTSTKTDPSAHGTNKDIYEEEEEDQPFLRKLSTSSSISLASKTSKSRTISVRLTCTRIPSSPPPAHPHHHESLEVSAPADFSSGRLEVEQGNLAIYETTPQWPGTEPQVEKEVVGWKRVEGSK